jgi:hypothetical protein
MTKFPYILSILLFFSIFNPIKNDLLVRSPPELKSQFISKQKYLNINNYKII